MKTGILLLSAAFFLMACSGEKKADSMDESLQGNISAAAVSNDNAGYDTENGEGRFTNVKIKTGVEKDKAAAGETVYQAKCLNCHRLTEEKLVGPGLKGVTGKRTAAWILNFITNTDAMLHKDPLAKAQLELCVVRMPNLNLTDEEALAVYEFMRANDR